MPDLGRLRWVMDVDTTRFDAGMRRARSGIHAIGSALAAMGAGRALGQAVDRGTMLVQGAAATGVSVQGLQELASVGLQTGVPTAELLNSLTAFSRNVGMLRQGRGPLKRIGGRASTALRQVAGAYASGGTEAALMALSGAVSGMEPGIGGAVAERAGFTGLAGYEFLAQGPAAIQRAREQYRRFNVPMSASQAQSLKTGGDVYAAAWEAGESVLFGSIGQRATEIMSGRPLQGLAGAGLVQEMARIAGILLQIERNTKGGSTLAP